MAPEFVAGCCDFCLKDTSVSLRYKNSGHWAGFWLGELTQRPCGDCLRASSAASSCRPVVSLCDDFRLSCDLEAYSKAYKVSSIASTLKL